MPFVLKSVSQMQSIWEKRKRKGLTKVVCPLHHIFGVNRWQNWTTTEQRRSWIQYRFDNKMKRPSSNSNKLHFHKYVYEPENTRRYFHGFHLYPKAVATIEFIRVTLGYN